MSWKFACNRNEISAGEMVSLNIDGVALLLVGADDFVTAIPPMCPHLDEPLETGMCDGKILTCIKHLWQWDLSTGSPIGLAEAPLKRYETKIQDGKVYVFLDRQLAYER